MFALFIVKAIFLALALTLTLTLTLNLNLNLNHKRNRARARARARLRARSPNDRNNQFTPHRFLSFSNLRKCIPDHLFLSSHNPAWKYC